jgi:hypothetical protein
MMLFSVIAISDFNVAVINKCDNIIYWSFNHIPKHISKQVLISATKKNDVIFIMTVIAISSDMVAVINNNVITILPVFFYG